MLDWLDVGTVWMVYVPSMLPMVLKEIRKAFIRNNMSWAAAVVVGVVLWFCEGAIFLL